MTQKLTGIADLKHDKFGLKMLFHCLFIGLFFFCPYWYLSKVDLKGLLAPIIGEKLLIFAYLLIYGVVAVVLLLLLKVYTKVILQRSADDFKVTAKKIDPLWTCVGILLPVLLVLISMLFAPGIMRYVSLSTWLSTGLPLLFIGMLGAIVEEVFFRGYFISLLRNQVRAGTAIFVSALTYTLICYFTSGMDGTYIFDAIMQLFGMFFFALMCTAIVYATDNLWNSVLVHGLYSMISGVLFRSSTTLTTSALVQYIYRTDNILLKGAREYAHQEVALPAMILALFVSILAYRVYRKKREKFIEEKWGAASDTLTQG